MSRVDPALERLALGTLLPAFVGESAPDQVPDWVRTLVRRGLAGVTLYGPNIVDHAQLRSLTSDIEQAGTDSSPLIALDEEGGDVTRISYWTGSRYPGSAALGAIDDPVLTEKVHHAMGAELADLGVNLDLAPSGDVNAVAENPVIGTRAFGSEAQLVARHTAAAVTGLQSAGIAACVKHFPGHGATRQDSHLEVPVVEASRELLAERELVPFVAAIEAGTRALMTAHVRVPALTGAEPATLSMAALTTTVRKELGFTGVVITDALDMRAITEQFGLARGAVRSLAAGSDLLCLGPLPTRTQVQEIITAIIDAVGAGTLPVARLEEANARVAELRDWSSARRAERPGPDQAANRRADSGRADSGRADSGRAGSGRADPNGDDAIGLTAARRAVHVSGRAPDPVGDAERQVRVIEIDSPPTISVGEVPWGLAQHFPDTARVDPNGHSEPWDILLASASELVAGVGADRRLVIVVRDAHRHAACRAYVEALVALRSDAIVVEMGLPVWRPDCETYIATYGAAAVNARAAAELLGAVTA